MGSHILVAKKSGMEWWKSFKRPSSRNPPGFYHWARHLGKWLFLGSCSLFAHHYICISQFKKHQDIHYKVWEFNFVVAPHSFQIEHDMPQKLRKIEKIQKYVLCIYNMFCQDASHVTSPFFLEKTTRGVEIPKLNQLSHEKKKTRILSNESWLFNRDPKQK